uniref:PCI domain-containing protein n=1 Tax=Polytomella parva TaxID=51329 RepID=A0A7S0YXQ5_9CHLO|mmetsp:Transcript_9274/g.17379  ORF Transcript_9274/g.17379 Transcript_9274/m.17379 type:complete len:398 (+) Transcript_9274:128-1321(+)|eukprot:CAMPEP_0175059826 /NCGR_PEP_ID=MMETSP0052_2-20121109/12649_1 /TAXON_ID=51329 ORGANISM="Polytomella parva, Strain SAG 63-3" /NCGR_SAMPLE_ID=MMETSP0052_2 /ASSEMBLY_ACC=CAM_ASM_000194 /LENGTH=397 /DNA_ID=CAMNT_0016325421 /DNA_START=25 /DNA_END=1218 /DNA_ORIENTATION=-
MTSNFREYFSVLMAEVPDMEEDIRELLNLHDNKLYHQITLKLQDIFENPLINQKDFPYQIYQSYISPLSTKLNLLKLSQFAVHASKYLSEAQDSISFLKSENEKIKKLRCTPSEREEATLFIQMHIAQHYLESGSPSEAKVIVRDGVKSLKQMRNVDPSVSASVYYVNSLLDKESRSYSEYYRNSLLYLSYVAHDSLPEDFKVQLAFDIALAALLGEKIFSFGNLLQHPIVDSLKASPSTSWAFELLTTFNKGDLTHYDELCVRHQAALNAQADLVQHERRLREKITIMCLLNFVSSLPSDGRIVSYDSVSERTGLSADGVELLFMKAFSLDLIRGLIDEVDRNVKVTWVAPRVLTLEQVQGFKEQLDRFVCKVESASKSVDEEAIGIVSLCPTKHV